MGNFLFTFSLVAITTSLEKDVERRGEMSAVHLFRVKLKVVPKANDRVGKWLQGNQLGLEDLYSKYRCIQACALNTFNSAMVNVTQMWHKDGFSPEVIVYKGFYSQSTQADIDKLSLIPEGKVLVECIIQTLVQVIEVQQNHGSSHIHADLDPIDILTDLLKKIIWLWQPSNH